jgi:hypothetical protein
MLIGLAGASSSGKSFSALRLARGLAGEKPFAAIDTESGRLLHYADRFQPWEYTPIGAPFRPAKYLEAINAADAKGYPVILVDSMSHEWDGSGGLLEWHDELMGGKETKKLSSWIIPKTEHRKFVNELLQVKAHLVLCFRASKKVEMIRGSDGKWEIVEKQSLTGLDGWMPITEKNLPYELTMSLLLTPERPGVPMPVKLQEQHRPFVPLDSHITEATGAALARWAAGDDKAEQSRASAEIEGHAQRLVEQILALALDDAKRQEMQNAINQQRAKHEADLGVFIAWLGSQLERLQAIAAEREQVQLDL